MRRNTQVENKSIHLLYIQRIENRRNMRKIVTHKKMAASSAFEPFGSRIYSLLILVHPNHKSIFFQPFRQGHGMTAAAQGAVYIYTMRIGEHRINHLMKKYGGMMEFHETLPL